MLDSLLLKLRHPVHNHRTQVRAVKIFGKHFLEKIPEKDMDQWRKENTGICWDVRTEKDLIDFMIKLKVEHQKMGSGSAKMFYVPDLNGTEAGIISVGHHTVHDGIS